VAIIVVMQPQKRKQQPNSFYVICSRQYNLVVLQLVTISEASVSDHNEQMIRFDIALRMLFRYPRDFEARYLSLLATTSGF
jgi:hypothetical protein